MTTYQQELRNFQQQWKLPDYDLNEYAKNDKGLRYAEAFLTGDSVDLSVGGEVVRWFSKTLEAYFKANTSLNADGNYISSFKPQDFYDSFKKLVQAKFDDDAKEKENATPLQVKDVLQNQKKNLESVMAKNMSQYQKTLPTLWAEKLKKGTMTQNELLLATSNVMDNMDSVIKSNDVPFEDRIINVVAAYETMKQIRESRTGFLGWLWKFIFRERNELEQTNLETFESQVNRLRNEGYPVDKIAAEITGKTVLGLEVKKVKAPAEPEVNPAKQDFQPINFEPCTEKMRNAYPETSKKVIKEIIDKLPVTNKFGGLFREQTLEAMFVQVFNRFNELNGQFDKDMPTGNQKDAIAKLARESFKVAQSVSVMATSGCNVDKIDACAMIAKLFIDNFTAVSTYPELDGIVNEYMKNNIALYKEIEAKGLSYGKEIDNYAVDYVPSEEYMKEQVFDNKNNPFIEQSVNQSAPVQQQPQINVPGIDK